MREAHVEADAILGAMEKAKQSDAWAIKQLILAYHHDDYLMDAGGWRLERQRNDEDRRIHGWTVGVGLRRKFRLESAAGSAILLRRSWSDANRRQVVKSEKFDERSRLECFLTSGGFE